MRFWEQRFAVISQVLSEAARQDGASDLSQKALAGHRVVRLTTQEIRNLIGVIVSNGQDEERAAKSQSLA